MASNHESSAKKLGCVRENNAACRRCLNAGTDCSLPTATPRKPRTARCLLCRCKRLDFTLTWALITNSQQRTKHAMGGMACGVPVVRTQTKSAYLNLAKELLPLVTSVV